MGEVIIRGRGGTSNHSHVPDEYQEVEYLQSSGTQYINTGVNTPSTRWGFEIDMTPLNPVGSTGYAIFGQKLANSNEWHLNCWFGNAGYNGTLFLKGNRYPAKMTQNVRQKLLLKHGVFINAEGAEYTVINQAVGDLPVYIFCVNNNNAAAEFSSVRLYNFKIYDTTDALVSNLYPCYRIADSVAGLWDAQRSVFLTNSGSGSFTVGADV